MIRILYFAQLREQLGVREEQLDIEVGETIARLIDRLCAARGTQWQALNEASVKVSINQCMTDKNRQLAEGDELAFFPPVTGG